MASKALKALTFIKGNSCCWQTSIRNNSYKCYSFIRDPQPSDIHTVKGGFQVIKPPTPKLTEVIESRDPEEWKFVEDVLPRKVVPDYPRHESYPTPSGWFPPQDPFKGEPYRVRRTRFHNFPLYRILLNTGRSPFTVIQHVQGDIKKLERDIKEFLKSRTGKTIYTIANEVCCKLWIKGVHMDDVKEFLTMKGF